MTVVIVTGTPGTGKTTLAKLVSDRLKYKYVDVRRVIREKKLSDGYDEEKKCDVVDARKLNKELVKIIEKEKNVVIDSHLSHYLPKKHVDLCLVTKCELKELERRLRKRYDKAKVRENLDAEIFDICYNEAKEAGHKVVVVDTTKGVDWSTVKLGLTKVT